MSTPLLIYAPNVRAGGGLVLLQSIVAAWTGEPRVTAVLDERAKANISVPEEIHVEWVQPGLLNRLRAEWRLGAALRSGARVLCFHGLPPFFLSEASGSKLTVFLQNRLLVESGTLRDYPILTRLRLEVERWLLRRRMHSVGEIIVQGPSMKRALAVLVGAVAGPRIQVRPLVPNDISASESARTFGRAFDFIYPADGEPHKNHARLVEAWELLKEGGCRPSLALTLGSKDQELWARLKVRIENAGLGIVNLGTLSRRQLVEVYGETGALIYPSTTESFGLPLAEARAIGLPIIAGEIDYVRDVCNPVQTFDPSSALSIARAINRYLRRGDCLREFETPEGFWKALSRDVEGVS
ncbi:hypothetical protein A1D31_36200 [Bradyrhizobium liaoningense]|nr:hypothetical protein A1D31_36200 [Bradyrhizobium liaoningense]